MKKSKEQPYSNEGLAILDELNRDIIHTFNKVYEHRETLNMNDYGAIIAELNDAAGMIKELCDRQQNKGENAKTEEKFVQTKLDFDREM